MDNLTKALKSTVDSMTKRGSKPDTIVVGSDLMAGKALASLQKLGLDFHVIADNEISPTRWYITSQEELSKFPGGGRN